MSEHRRRLGLLATGAASLALIAGPLTVVAQDGDMAMASDQCQAGAIDEYLKTPGRLTISTDNPAFGPWWGGDPSVDTDSGWEFGYPPSGEGLEGGVITAVAHALGFADDQIDWIQNSEFALAFQPGPKPFDVHLAQISIRPERAENVDFSDPYFDANQSLVGVEGTDITSATTLDELKSYNLGAAVGTTSLQFIEEVIVPDSDPSVFNNNADLVQALDNQQIDGMVIDVGSAFFSVAVQLEAGTIVGQFNTSAQEEQLGIVLDLDSPLTACVNEALVVLSESGELQAVYDATITDALGVPVIE
jgi:polar amino acid transport system substrate-binding protein